MQTACQTSQGLNKPHHIHIGVLVTTATRPKLHVNLDKNFILIYNNTMYYNVTMGCVRATIVAVEKQ